MTKWEYMTAPVLVHATKQILDNFGEDGWELVQIVPGLNPENLVAYFKRPRCMSTPRSGSPTWGSRSPRWPSRSPRTSPRSAAAATSSPPDSCRCATAS